MIEELVEIAKEDKRVNIDFTINNVYQFIINDIFVLSIGLVYFNTIFKYFSFCRGRRPCLPTFLF